MKFALDVNAALKWVLDEPDSDFAKAFRDDFAAGIHELIAPDTFPIEAAHVLTRTQRQGLITDAQEKLDDILANAPELHTPTCLCWDEPSRFPRNAAWEYPIACTSRSRR